MPLIRSSTPSWDNTGTRCPQLNVTLFESVQPGASSLQGEIMGSTAGAKPNAGACVWWIQPAGLLLQVRLDTSDPTRMNALCSVAAVKFNPNPLQEIQFNVSESRLVLGDSLALHVTYDDPSTSRQVAVTHQ